MDAVSAVEILQTKVKNKVKLFSDLLSYLLSYTRTFLRMLCLESFAKLLIKYSI